MYYPPFYFAVRTTILFLLILCTGTKNIHALCTHSLQICIDSLPVPDENTLFGVFDTIKRAAIPLRLDNAIASGVAEAVSGGLGALASRRVADIIGDKKRDTAITKISATSAFFGTRSLIRITARLAGIPRPIAILLATVFGSIVSELAKFQGRSKDGISSDYLVWDEIISFPEIAGDVSKWIIYDAAKETITGEIPLSKLLLPQERGLYDLIEMYLLQPYSSSIFAEDVINFFLGVTAAIGGSVVKDVASAVGGENSAKTPVQATVEANASKKDVGLRYSQSAIEGGILFLTYEIVLKLSKLVVPDSLNEVLIFDKVLDIVEEEIKEVTR